MGVFLLASLYFCGLSKRAWAQRVSVFYASDCGAHSIVSVCASKGLVFSASLERSFRKAKDLLMIVGEAIPAMKEPPNVAIWANI